MNSSSQPKLSCVLLIGAESPYGYPHLEAFLSDDRFDINLVVLPTPARTSKFYASLNGSPYHPPRSTGQRIAKALSNPAVVASAIRDRLHPEESPTVRAKRMCQQRGLPVIMCDDANEAGFLRDLEAVKADYALSAAYPQIFSLDFLDSAATSLCANSHPSLLPKYRGAHPVYWAVRNGETETGLTFHILTSQIDHGAILARVRVPIDRLDHRGHVSAKIAAAVPSLTRQLADNLLAPDFSPLPQNCSESSLYRQDREIHHLIQWGSEPAEGLRNLVRACAGDAFCFADGSRLKIATCEVLTTNRNLTNSLRVEPGTIVDLDAEGFTVAASDGTVRVTEWSGIGFQPMIGKVLG